METIRMLLGGYSFGTAALFVCRNIGAESVRPLFLIVGTAFGITLTGATRNASNNAMGRALVVLGMLSVGLIVGMALLEPATDVYIGFMPLNTLFTLELLSLSAWLFWSSRAKQPEIRDSVAQEVFG